MLIKLKGYDTDTEDWVNLKVDSSGRLIIAPISPIIRLYNRASAQLNIVNSVAETIFYSFTITGGDLSTNKVLHIKIIGDYFNNRGASSRVTVKIYLNDSVIYEDISVSFTNNVARIPYIFDLLLANQNVVNSQVLGGNLRFGVPDGATIGIGDMGTDEIRLDTPIFGVSTEDTSSDLLFKITITHTDAHANTSMRRQYAFSELI